MPDERTRPYESRHPSGYPAAMDSELMMARRHDVEERLNASGDTWRLTMVPLNIIDIEGTSAERTARGGVVAMRDLAHHQATIERYAADMRAGHPEGAVFKYEGR